MLLTVEIKINIGTMTIQICIKSSSSLVRPENPRTLELVTPLTKNIAINPENISKYTINHFERKDSMMSNFEIKSKFFKKLS